MRAMRFSWLLLALPYGGCNSARDAKDDLHGEPALDAAGVAGIAEVPRAAEDSVAAAAPTREPVPADYEVASSPGGLFTAAWRPVGGTVPINELFEIEVLVFEGRAELPGQDTARTPGQPPVIGKPLSGASVRMTAWMPEHMHGMSRKTETTETAPGRYLVRGMMLHMEGFWQFFVDVMAGSVTERAEFEYRAESLAPPAVAGFTPDELRKILQLSPLPDPPPDATNRHAADPRAARLGQFAFFDPRFSASGKVSCSTCHQPALAFADGKHFGEAGVEPGKVLDRHTPSLFNVAYNRWWFWDGRADSMWAQPLRPLEDPREHAFSRLEIAHALRADAGLARAYEETFGPLPELADAQRFPPRGKPGDAAWDAMAPADQLAVDRVFTNFGKSLAAYERRLVTRAAPFDDFVAGVRSGSAEKQASLSPAAREGVRLFVGEARCILCHSGPNFTDREFHDNRVPTLDGGPRRDAGRHHGIPQVQEDPFNGAGKFSDAPEGESQDKLRFLPRHRDSFSEFKTPTLRNVALTAPYMHQGQIATLDEVLAYYNTLELAVPTHSPERTLQAINLSAEQLAALREFLVSLTAARLDDELLKQPPTPYQP